LKATADSITSSDKPPRRILGLQLKRLGDVILTLPAMQILRDAFPQAEVELLVDASLSGIGPFVESCRILPAPSSPVGLFRFFQEGRDVVLDFSGQDRCLLLALLSRAPTKLTFRKFFKKPMRSWVFTGAVKSSLREQHVSKHLADLTLAVAEKGVCRAPLLRCGEQEVAGFFSKAASCDSGKALRAGQPYLLFHPGTAREEKFWSPEGWARVISFASEKTDIPVVLTSSSAPEEKAHLAAIVERLAFPVVLLAGNLSLGEFFAAIANASLLAGVDSAPLHLADAFGTPILALFGPTDPAIWGPQFSRRLVIRSPSGTNGQFPMHLLELEKVIRELDRFFETGSGD